MDRSERIKELIEILNRASKAYYSDNAEIMSNYEYDALYDELAALERETGLIYNNSPTQNVGYEAAAELVKERHSQSALSLDKTKEVSALADFLKDQEGLLSWKLDGLTIVLTYSEGKLLKAVTRGNGEIGEVVTANARTFVNLPAVIPYKGELVIRGEAVIKYSDFEKINAQIPESEAKYKNPRNLCSGSVRQLDSAVTAKRNVNLIVFSLVSCQGVDFKNSHEQMFMWLKGQGFDVVPYKRVNASSVEAAVKEYAKEIETYEIPSDGLVLLMDDIEYGRSLGRTAKFPRNSIAFKWKDETAVTTIRDIEWSPSRTGLINPVAVFDPVELEGTTVSRASVHNVSIIESLKLGIGDQVKVYKANMIIPQIAENLTQSGTLKIPDVCPACAKETVIKDDNGVKTLICPSPECPAKRIKSFENYVSRNCLDIEGISEETLDKFAGHGFLHDFADLYRLEEHREEIISMPGFGEQSYSNIIDAVNRSRTTTCARLLAGLGIPGVGRANAVMICRHFDNDFERVRNANKEELTEIDGVGDVIADEMCAFFADPFNSDLTDRILKEITFKEEQSSADSAKLSGMTFVITGSLESYPNRDALKAEIESLGGKVSSGVSKKTSFLINNDITSGSGKNKTAKSLGIPIITEAEYRSRYGADPGQDK